MLLPLQQFTVQGQPKAEAASLQLEVDLHPAPGAAQVLLAMFTSKVLLSAKGSMQEILPLSFSHGEAKRFAALISMANMKNLRVRCQINDCVSV